MATEKPTSMFPLVSHHMLALFIAMSDSDCFLVPCLPMSIAAGQWAPVAQPAMIFFGRKHFLMVVFHPKCLLVRSEHFSVVHPLMFAQTKNTFGYVWCLKTRSNNVKHLPFLYMSGVLWGPRTRCFALKPPATFPVRWSSWGGQRGQPTWSNEIRWMVAKSEPPVESDALSWFIPLSIGFQACKVMQDFATTTSIYKSCFSIGLSHFGAWQGILWANTDWWLQHWAVNNRSHVNLLPTKTGDLPTIDWGCYQWLEEKTHGLLDKKQIIVLCFSQL